MVGADVQKNLEPKEVMVGVGYKGVVVGHSV